MSNKKLRVISGRTGPVPVPTPDRLGVHGAALWRRVHAEYQIPDAGGIELLTLACQARDRAAECRAQIDKDGLTLTTERGVFAHPLLKHELQAQAFVARTLARLGLDVEPIRPNVGRPPGLVG